ncbi:hypothetical protein [Streptomyces sp. R33]|uniref:Uncharacterized protein n=1 Tax=Streptomyces sp. R33 TaxID=3238629 RepID=A0AB39XXH6_9ACTN
MGTWRPASLAASHQERLLPVAADPVEDLVGSRLGVRAYRDDDGVHLPTAQPRGPGPLHRGARPTGTTDTTAHS